MPRVVVMVLLGVYLQVCRAHELNCDMSRDGNKVIYKVPSVIEHMRLGSYSWDDNDTVVATNTHPAENEHVYNSTPDALITSKCFHGLVLTKHYISKNENVQDFTANCSTSCDEVFQDNQVQDEPSNIRTKVGDGDGDGDGLGLGLGLGGVVLLVLILAIIFRKKIFRKCCCSQTGGFFTPVKVIQEAHREEVNLESISVRQAS